MDVVYDFNSEKSIKLKEERGISFEDIIALIEEDSILDIIEHTNHTKYPNQKMYVIDIEGYIYLVPFVRTGNRIFLKTIFPSRKATKDYLTEGEE